MAVSSGGHFPATFLVWYQLCPIYQIWHFEGSDLLLAGQAGLLISSFLSISHRLDTSPTQTLVFFGVGGHYISLLWECVRIIFYLIWKCLASWICFVDWGCKIHWLHLCRGERAPRQTSALCNLIVRFQSAGAVKYTDCISVEGEEPLPNKCPGYDTKQSNFEALVGCGCKIHQLHLCRRVKLAERVSWIWH